MYLMKSKLLSFTLMREIVSNKQKEEQKLNLKQITV